MQYGQSRALAAGTESERAWIKMAEKCAGTLEKNKSEYCDKITILIAIGLIDFKNFVMQNGIGEVVEGLR